MPLTRRPPARPARRCSTSKDCSGSGDRTGINPLLEPPVLIPRDVLQYGPARFPLRGWWLRFDVSAGNAKAAFVVRKNVAMALPSGAGKLVD
jgi:hypothetical protein